MKYFSMFSGIGGFEIGIQNSGRFLQGKISENIQDMSDSTERPVGPTCVGYSEIDKYAIQIYEKHFGCKVCNGDGEYQKRNEGAGTPIKSIQATDAGSQSRGDSSIINRRSQELHNCKGHKNYGDAARIVPEEIPDFDILVGGFPCQSFSIAGKRGGFNDTRGTMFFEIARILKVKTPRLILLENVKGLLSHDSGKTFQTILKVLSDIGYGVQWQVLNSKNFGVPQNRERVFIIGHLRGTSRPEVFPIGGGSEETTGQVINPLKNKTDYGWHLEQNIYDAEGITRTVKAGGGSGNMPKVIQQLNKPTHSNDRVYGTYGVSPTLNTMQGGNRQPFVVASRGRNKDNPSDRTPGNEVEQRLEPNSQGTTNALTSVQKDNWLLQNSKIRRLTTTECERLQGFPDGWTKYGADGQQMSDTQRYKCLGNAVTVNVIEAIMDKLSLHQELF